MPLKPAYECHVMNALQYTKIYIQWFLYHSQNVYFLKTKGYNWSYYIPFRVLVLRNILYVVQFCIFSVNSFSMVHIALKAGFIKFIVIQYNTMQYITYRF